MEKSTSPPSGQADDAEGREDGERRKSQAFEPFWAGPTEEGNPS